MNLNKDDFDALRKQIDGWTMKPTKILMHSSVWKCLILMDLIDLYVSILKHGCKVESCKEIRPNEYEIYIDSKWGGTFTLKPRGQ